jgi:signal peptidase I
MSSARLVKWAAFALSLTMTGLGHVAVGRARRGVAWFGVMLGGIAAGYVIAGLGQPYLWWSVLVLLPVVHLVCALDSWRFQRPPGPARAGRVVASALAMAAAIGLVTSGGRRWVVEPHDIPSAAMYPTVITGDRVMASKIGGRFVPGDVVVFRFPIADELTYLKRIVAVGGDHVETRQGRLWINDRPVERRDTGRPCLTLGPRASCRIWEENLGGRLYLVATREDAPTSSRRVVVPPDHVFVLGDNRDRSADSRHYGAIPNRRLIGHPRFIFWSATPTGVRWARLNDVVR